MNTSDNPIGFVGCPQNLFSLGLLRCISPPGIFNARIILKNLFCLTGAFWSGSRLRTTLDGRILGSLDRWN